jgi:hypothetical protein
VPRVHRGAVVQFSTFSPKALAAIGDALPATLADRSIPLRVQRRAPGEEVERFPTQPARAEAEILRHELRVVAKQVEAAADNLPPVALDGLDDRAADALEPLLAIAQVAGGDWPARAAEAALALMGTKDEQDRGVRLLTDIYALAVANDWQDKTGTIGTGTLLICLQTLQNGEYEADAQTEEDLDAITVARLLRPFGLRPKVARHPAAVFTEGTA